MGEKIITSKLYEKSANRRIFSVDSHVGLAGSGLYADVRQLADIAMTEAANYKSEYGSPIPVKYLTDRVSNYVHAYTLYSALRPFGTTIMMGSYTDIDGPELYCIEIRDFITVTGAVLLVRQNNLQRQKSKN